MTRAAPIWDRFAVRPGGEFGADRSRLGPPVPPTHTGTDFAAPRGTPVPAMLAGRVLIAGWGDRYSGYVVRVLADNGRSVLHAHGERTLARVGERVDADQVVMLSGGSGSASTGPHLHTELCIDHRGHRSATDCWRARTLRDLMIELAGEEDAMALTEEDEKKVKALIRAVLDNEPQLVMFALAKATHELVENIKRGEKIGP